VSATLSDTGPTPAIPETAALTTAAVPGPSASGILSPASPSPLAKRAKPTKESRPHVIAFDLIRLIIMVFVVSVHTLAFGGGQVTVVLGAFTTVFHTSRELFFLLTALVLTYNYGHRRNVRWLAFWRRRYWLVVPAYVAWSAIYFAADGHWPGSAGAVATAFWHDLLTAGARYHLYFLLVTMQVYLLFPVLRWVLRKTEGHHLALFLAACVYQLALTAAIQHHPVHSGLLVGWLNGAGQGIWLESYVLYVVGGAIAGWHFDQLRAFAARHASAATIALSVGVGVAAGLGMYFAELARGASPAAASAVFQPVVVVEALAFGWALLMAGLLWADRGARHKKFFAAGSASSFGIYLAHPLVLQGLLAVGSATGVLAVVRGAPAGVEVLVLLGVAVPLVYGASWVIASAARRTPLSLMLTGREYSARKRRSGTTPSQKEPRAQP